MCVLKFIFSDKINSFPTLNIINGNAMVLYRKSRNLIHYLLKMTLHKNNHSENLVRENLVRYKKNL